MSDTDRHVGSRFGHIERDWTPAPIEDAAAAYVLMALAADRPDSLALARAFQAYCEEHPQHGYDPEDGYYKALDIAGQVRVLLIPTDELDYIPPRWRYAS